MEIRPVSDLRNKFTEIEKVVEQGDPVYLTKNGYGTMVVLSIDAYTNLTGTVERALEYADCMAALQEERLTHEEMFAKLRESNEK